MTLEEKENLISLANHGNIQLVIKNLPNKIPEGFTAKFSPIFKEQIIPVLHKLFRK